MSNWAEREETERFDAWASPVGVVECSECYGLVRIAVLDEHEKSHGTLLATSPSLFGGTE